MIKQTRLLLLSCALSLALAANAQDNHYVIVDEDFAAFTDGTEDEPSTASLLDAQGFIADSTLLKPFAPDCTRTWGGYNLFSAGGCLAVMNGGFVNTPAGDFSGELTITFRARLLKGVTTTDRSLEVLLISSKQLVDYKRQTITLTPAWKTYTVTATNGGFANTMVQLFTMNDDLSYLVDDVRIEHTINSIVPPEAYDATDLKADGFTANWDTTATANQYLLSVYTKQDNPETLSVSEGFESIVCDESGVVDSTNANLPEGWEIQWNGTGSTPGMCRTAGYYANGRQSLRLSSSGDYVATPAYSTNLETFSFWIKGRDKNNDADNPPTGLVQISGLTSSGWMPWAYVSVEQLCALGKGTVLDRTDKIASFEELRGVKITYLPGDGDNCEIYLDDINYSVTGADLLDYALFDHVVEGRSSDHYTVSGLDEDKDYYFSVKARNDEFTSVASEEIEVFDVHQPHALEATDIDLTQDSYTANWTCGSKADYFRVDQMKVRTLTEDTPDFVILEEDFSRVTSDVTDDHLDTPEECEYTSNYLAIDDYTQLAGWKGASLQKVNGWLGGMASSGNTGELAGAIVTPTIDLSHNDGECKVTVRAYGEQGDWLVVRGTNTAAYAGIEFPDSGLVERTVSLPLCNERDNLTFYSNNYRPFLIDYIRVVQDVKAGDRVTIVDKSFSTADNTPRSMQMTAAGLQSASDVEYKVTAFRYYHGDTTNVWNSLASESIVVRRADPAGVDVQKLHKGSVQGVEGGIVVDLVAASDVVVYDTKGALQTSLTKPSGTSFLPFHPGLYIVKTSGQAVKVVVK